MFRKLPLALILGTLLTAGDALALGVGDIKVNSALNQKLDAEIELLSTVEGELDDVTVSLASKEAFERINLNRPYVLTAIQFKVQTRADGTPIVKLTSTETVREPFLDFLVEVHWAKGRMLREYTVLLDPPVSMASPSAQVTSVGSASSEPQVFSYDASGAERAVGNTSTGSSYSGSSYNSDSYGPVAAQETLWSIASRVKSGDVSTQQMMLALFDNNPDAFVNNDIHQIKKGAVLRIPADSAVTQRDRYDAIAEVRQINSRLGVSESAGVPEQMADSMSGSSSSSYSDRLNIISPDNASSMGSGSASDDVSALKRELAMATETMASQRLENEELQSRVHELEATVQEMDKLKRLLEMQNQEMAKLQQQLSSDGSEEPASQPAVEPEPPQPVVEEPVQAVVEEAPKPQPVKPAPLPPPVKKEPIDVVMDYVNQAKNNPVILGAVAAVVIILAALVALIMRRRKKGGSEDSDVIEESTPEPVEESAVEEEAEKSAKKSPFAGLAASIAGLKEKLQSLTKKKDKSADDVADMEFEDDSENVTEQNFGAGADDDVTPDDATVLEAPAGGDEPSFDDMMFEEDDSVAAEATQAFDPAATAVGEEPLMEEPASDEPDPLEEVDVYEAFGDFEQAAEIVKQAINDQPGNNRFKLRLFKVYESGSMSAEFSDAAVNYQADMQGSPEWDEVESIGKAFVPDCPAWSGGGAAPAAAPADDNSADMDDIMSEMTQDQGADAMDLDFELDDSTASEEVSADDDDSASLDLGDLDFESADTDSENTPEPQPALESEPDVDNSMEFDLGDLNFETADSETDQTDSSDTDTSAADEPVGNEMEFDLGDMDFGAAEEAPADEPAEPEPMGNEMEFDLGDMNFEPADDSVADEPESIEEPVGIEEPEGIEEPDSIGDDLDSLEFELDSAPAEEPVEGFADESNTVQLDMTASELEAQAAEADSSEDPTIMFPEEGDSSEEPAEESPDLSMGVDLSDFSFDIEESGNAEALPMEDGPDSEDPTQLLQDADDALDSLSDGSDEVSTKLDLARAYIDMGDSEGAKGILEEVLSEGNDDQKSEAQDLMSKL